MVQRLGRARSAGGDTACAADPVKAGDVDSRGAESGTGGEGASELPGAGPGGMTDGAPAGADRLGPADAGPQSPDGAAAGAGQPARPRPGAKSTALPEDFSLSQHDPLRAPFRGRRHHDRG
jgi:hypothetical protein